MNFSSKLMQLRREKGWSQEQLADLLGVTRQSVSKWEAGSALPEIAKLVSISNQFGVSVDVLVRDELDLHAEENAESDPVSPSSSEQQEALLEELGEIKKYIRNKNFFEYKSKIHLFGIPLVHVVLSQVGPVKMARGIIAIGNAALGVVSLGGFSMGVVSMGGLSAGLLFSIGGVSLGTIALGGCAIGLLAIGGAAIGVYALGGAALGGVVASGGSASAPVAIGRSVKGIHTLVSDGVSSHQIQNFLHQNVPGMWEPLVRLFSMR